MKSAWEALDGSVRDWYVQRLTLESYYPNQQAFRTEVHRLFRALEEYDLPTARHALRVCRYAEWLGQGLALDQTAQAQLSLAAQLHDVGKLCVPHDLLRRVGDFTPAEQRLVQEHTAFGERLVRILTPCPAVQKAVRWHHERLDGGGYPDGLRGAGIPLFARALAIADAFDALTFPRAPGHALPWPAALAELRRGAGDQLDPALVECFAGAMGRHQESNAAGAGMTALAAADAT